MFKKLWKRFSKTAVDVGKTELEVTEVTVKVPGAAEVKLEPKKEESLFPIADFEQIKEYDGRQSLRSRIKYAVQSNPNTWGATAFLGILAIIWWLLDWGSPFSVLFQD